MTRSSLAILFCALLCSCSRPPITDCAVVAKYYRAAWTQQIHHRTEHSYWMETVHHPARWWIDVSGCPTNGPDAGVYETRTLYVEREQWEAIEEGQRFGDVL